MYGGTSFDLTDHKEILAAYDNFLDQWNFRSAFPTTEHLFIALGKKCYDTWQNYLENARISDDLDFAAISGWETTAIENHSGIVDNLRNFKSDPTPITDTLHPSAPSPSSAAPAPHAANPPPSTSTCSTTPATRDRHPHLHRHHSLEQTHQARRIPAPTHVTDQFSYLIKESFQTPALTEEGLYRFKFSLSSAPLSTQTKEIWVTEPPAYKRARALSVAVSGITPALHKQLTALAPRLGLEVEDFTPGKKYDIIVSSGLTAQTSATQNAGDTTGLEAQPAARPNTAPGVGRPEPGEAAPITQLGHIDPAILEAVRAGTPLLAIPQADTLSEGVAKQLAAAGAFKYNGTVGDFRAPWMGNWYFVREHPIYAGLPVNQAMGIHYQAKGRQSNGLFVEGSQDARNHRRLLPRPRPQHRRRHLHHQTRQHKNPLPARPRTPSGPATTLPGQCARLAHHLSSRILERLKHEEAAPRAAFRDIQPRFIYAEQDDASRSASAAAFFGSTTAPSLIVIMMRLGVYEA